MDDLTRVRQLTADTPPLTENSRAAAHAGLRDAIARETRRGRSGAPSRRLVLYAATATVGVAVAGTVVATQVGGKGAGNAVGNSATDAPRGAPMDAAKTLGDAARTARSSPLTLPIPRKDQYVYSRTHVQHTYEADGRVRTWTDETWQAMDRYQPSKRVEGGKVHNDPPLGKHQVPSLPYEYDTLKQLTTDPDQLLRQWGFQESAGPKDNVLVFFRLCMVLKEPRVLPPVLRATTFGALARLPGVKATTDELDAFGRRGFALSFPTASFTFVFDRETSDFLGQRTRGSHSEMVNGEWKQVGWYFEITSREEMGVVDGIDQRP